MFNYELKSSADIVEASLPMSRTTPLRGYPPGGTDNAQQVQGSERLPCSCNRQASGRWNAENTKRHMK